MTRADGRYTVCYNGEIYNYDDLRADIERSGQVFTTTCDTEIIPLGFAVYGEGLYIRQGQSHRHWETRSRVDFGPGTDWLDYKEFGNSFFSAPFFAVRGPCSWLGAPALGPPIRDDGLFQPP